MRRNNAILSHFNLRCIPSTTPVKTGRNENGSDNERRQCEILEMKKIYALSKDLRFMLALNPEAISGVQAA
jgi:hypothetical protein